MSGPVRLREGGSALERELTSSADIDLPVDGAKQRAFATLGIVAGASVAPAVATAAVKRALFGLHISSTVKIVSVVALASATAIGGYEIHARHSATHANELPSTVVVPATPVAAAPVVVMPTPIEIAPSSAPKMIATPPASREPASTSRPRHDDIAELDWIDRAQSALKTNPARALEVVDGYRQNVSPRAFDEEATVIAIEASERTGDPERAQREADQFSVVYPHSAYRSRIDALLAAGPGAGK
ncbi:MAG: hypothetical protein ABI183_06905 [Polyangiaceae bacterium]